MAIKKARKIQRISVEAEKPKKESKGTLPDDEYQDEIPRKGIEIDEETKIIVSVKRMGEYGLPYADIRIFVDNDRFTGFTKKGLSFPVENLLELIGVLQEAQDECEEKGLIE